LDEYHGFWPPVNRVSLDRGNHTGGKQRTKSFGGRGDGKRKGKHWTSLYPEQDSPEGVIVYKYLKEIVGEKKGGGRQKREHSH